MMRAPDEQFRAAIAASGLTAPDAIIADGELHRFASNGTRGDDAGWYVYHGNGVPAGGFGCWRTGLSESWRANIGRKLTPAEVAAQSQRIADARAKREAEQTRLHAEARARAGERWHNAKPADPAHPYLTRKGIQPHGIRQEGELLLIPMRDGDGELWNVERITPEIGERKKALAGGRRDGLYHSFGKPDGVICIAEGYATGATIHEATGHAVAVAFGSGNVPAVAAALRAKWPDVRIILCADDDYRTAGNPGMTKATEAAGAVGGLVAVPDFGDDRPDGATDFNDLAQHRGAEAVRKAVERASAPQAPDQPHAGMAAAGDSDDSAWPAAMDPAALHGIAGEFVRMIEPDTESDPAAILVQFLVAFGALVGRGPHYRVEGDEHHANLFAVLVGQSSKARKGTSWGRVRAVFERVADWKPHVSGLSSGEGLKYHVRDAREETKESKHGELVTTIVDAGVDDKRLLAVESEFASVLRASQRQGSTLSATLREGWDSGTLRTLTKNDPITATGAHVCIVAHVTADELRAELTATDTANGFANRFLFVAVRRSKSLPHGGGRADEAEVQALVARLRERAALARTRGRLAWTPAAREIWERVYQELSEGHDGLRGAVTGRAEAQTLRLALIYALLDGADGIDAPHLMAALAVWQYCDATALYLFGGSIGDRIADEIMRRLVQAGDVGVTRTEMSGAFGRHQSGERIGAALDLLKRKGRATCESVNTGGRPAETWRATK